MALVCLGWVPWGNSWKRNQSMVYELSRLPLFDRVVFINPRAMWVGGELRFGGGPLRHRVSRVMSSFPQVYDSKIRICSMVRFIPFKRVLPRSCELEDWIFRRLLRSLKGNRPYILLNNHPNFFSQELLVELMNESSLTVFDISDDFVEFFEKEEHRSLFERNMRFCCSHAGMVFTVNEHLKAKYGDCNPHTFVVPNATNFSNFHRDIYRSIPFMNAIKARGGPILGYTGIINRVRLDYGLLEEVVRERPDCQFVFIGSADESFKPIAERHPNVHHHHQVHYHVLPDWVEYFDAAIIPFQINEHTRGNDLLKFNDYLAMGKSIVTTDIGGARRYEGLLWIASDSQSFLRCIDAALRGVTPEMRARRKETARENSWDRKALEIQALMLKHLKSPRSSS